MICCCCCCRLCWSVSGSGGPAHAGGALWQALGGNIFNYPLCLGFVWSAETSFGLCNFGSLGSPQQRLCLWCYHPLGFRDFCPRPVDVPAPRTAGTPLGTSMLSLIMLAILLLVIGTRRGQVSLGMGYGAVAFYVVYFVYEFLAFFEIIPKICPLGKLTPRCI